MAAAYASSSLPLTLLSWNLSQTQPSSSAPNSELRNRESSRLVRLEALRHRPDIIALQECPWPTWGDEEFGSCDYVSMGTKRSHCGYVDLLLRRDLARCSRPLTGVNRAAHIPSVAATIILRNRARIAVSSSHMAPFKDGAPDRASQFSALMGSMASECDDCVLLGDMNMRVAEDAGIESLCGGGWIDAWKDVGSSSTTKFTWDSYVNSYHGGNGFRFKARFDRAYVRGDRFSVKKFGLAGNRPIKKDEGGAGKGDYLSDHFGLVVGLEVSAPIEERKEVEDAIDLTGDDSD